MCYNILYRVWSVSSYIYNEKTNNKEDTIKKCYDFDILNGLTNKGYPYPQSHKNKSVTLTK